MNNDSNIDLNNADETNNDVVNAANNNSNKKPIKQRASGVLNDLGSLYSKKAGLNSKSKNKKNNVPKKTNQTPNAGNGASNKNALHNPNNASGLQQQNEGRKKLNDMKGNAKPKDEKAEQRQKRMNRAIQIAKHIPIPQVKAAAEAADKVNKGKNVASKGLNKAKKKESSNDSSNKSENSPIPGILQLFWYRRIIFFALPLLLFFLVIMGMFAITSSQVSSSASEMNEGLCVADYDVPEGKNEKCTEMSEEEKNFHKRVKEVKEEYSNDGKEFDALYIVGFYLTVKQTGESDITYDSMTKDKIKSIANGMFKKENDTYTFDEKTFKNNLVGKILPEYLPKHNKGYYDYLATQIFKYVYRYREIYGTKSDDDSGDSDMANRLVEVAQHEFDHYKEGSRGAKYRNWLRPGSGYFYWCATFVSWCANKAGIPTKIIRHSALVDDFITQARGQHADHKPSSGYKPKPGDLVIWKQSLYSNSRFESHIGIVKSYNSKTKKLVTLEGNSNDAVRQNTYNGIGDVGIFFSPKYPSAFDTAGSIKNGKTINLPKGLGTEGSREFDLANTKSEIAYSRSQMRCCRRITNPYAFPEGTPQRAVQDIWIKKGAKYKNGFCAIDGRILVATTTTFGKAGRKVDFYMSGGKVIKTIIVDTKSQGDDGCTKWGHKNGACVLEFTGKTSKIGDNPYHALGLQGQTVKRAVMGGSILK